MFWTECTQKSSCYNEGSDWGGVTRVLETIFISKKHMGGFYCYWSASKAAHGKVLNLFKTNPAGAILDCKRYSLKKIKLN